MDRAPSTEHLEMQAVLTESIQAPISKPQINPRQVPQPLLHHGTRSRVLDSTVPNQANPVEQ